MYTHTHTHTRAHTHTHTHTHTYMQVKQVGEGFMPSYLEIAQRRSKLPFTGPLKNCVLFLKKVFSSCTYTLKNCVLFLKKVFSYDTNVFSC